ncbi:hypothetical protein F183_A47960 [Bryobacterales bacterium F-183]|nr:hypothetical protein F183_A47960 [Bryobacterales bacterium F-183]
MQQGTQPPPPGTNRRQRQRVRKILGPIVDLLIGEDGGHYRSRARIVDYHDNGVGLSCREPVSPGTIIQFEDDLRQARKGKVTWCHKGLGSEYRIGVTYELRPNAANAESPEGEADGAAPDDGSVEADYYELLQINPKADVETIHRVYRLQAQRFHPDNKETGDEQMFRLLTKGYQTLTDPEQRAAYDLRLTKIQQRRWKIFEKPVQVMGVEGERRKRQGILGMLYNKCIQEPRTPELTMHEFETMLGVPKEHLEFNFWYLREAGFVTRSDNGRFTITIKGVDYFEEQSTAAAAAAAAAESARQTREDRLLAS